MTDCCIIGGGIIGLSIARELAGRGRSVRLLARERRHDTASWAAAGIFPPAPEHAGDSPNEALTAWSDRLHRDWARQLLDETGIDNGLRPCGGLHICRDADSLPALAAVAESWRERGVACESLDARGVAGWEPALADAVARGAVIGGYALPEETQIRPPRHLEALERSCVARGVVISSGATVHRILVDADRITGAEVDLDGTSELVRAGVFVLAAGAWSAELAESLRLTIQTRPIRGQIALVRLPVPRLVRVVNRGLDYLVPREDGTLLVGSTIEDVGFDSTTDERAVERWPTTCSAVCRPRGPSGRGLGCGRDRSTGCRRSAACPRAAMGLWRRGTSEPVCTNRPARPWRLPISWRAASPDSSSMRSPRTGPSSSAGRTPGPRCWPEPRRPADQAARGERRR